VKVLKGKKGETPFSPYLRRCFRPGKRKDSFNGRKHDTEKRPDLWSKREMDMAKGTFPSHDEG